MKNTRTALFFSTLLLAAPGITLAEEIKIPVGQQSNSLQDIDRPQSGITKAAVETKFGKPNEFSDPVGDPPITRWEYDNFTVVFERDRVIHTVLKHNK